MDWSWSLYNAAKRIHFRRGIFLLALPEFCQTNRHNPKPSFHTKPEDTQWPEHLGQVQTEKLRWHHWQLITRRTKRGKETLRGWKNLKPSSQKSRLEQSQLLPRQPELYLVSTTPRGWVGDVQLGPAVLPDVVNVQLIVQVGLWEETAAQPSSAFGVKIAKHNLLRRQGRRTVSSCTALGGSNSSTELECSFPNPWWQPEIWGFKKPELSTGSG